jgi:hypothetical protein
MRKLLIGLVLSVMAVSAQAQWVFVSENENGTKFYADPATKRRTGKVVRIWEITEYSKPRVVKGKAYYSDRAYEQYDCAERTSQTLQITGFSGKMASGESVGSDAQPGNKTFVAPGTSVETMLNFACK